MRRSLGAALWTVVGLLACFLGTLAGLTNSDAGRHLLAQMAQGVVTRVLAGHIEVSEVSGALITGVVLRDVRITDPDGTPVATIARVEASYTPFDLSARRIVLMELVLDSPRVTIVEHRDGRLNVEELPRRREGPRILSTPPLVQFRNVTVRDGALELRLQDAPSPDDSLHEIADGGDDGRWRVRRFTGVNAQLSALRVSDPRRSGVQADIDSLAVTVSDPRVRVRDATGRVNVVGDSVALDLEHLGLPGSALALRGNLTWPRGPIRYHLDADADSVTLADLRFIDARFPDDAVFRGKAEIRSRSDRMLAVQLEPLDLRHAGGRLTGELTAISVSGQGLTEIENATLTAENFDLEFARPFLDTLPFAGRLTGRTVATGPVHALALAIDWSFRDSLVSGWPETRLAGGGVVDVGAKDGGGLAFQQFVLDSGRVDLGTVRRLVPEVRLAGTLEGKGTLNGSLKDARFAGTLRHQDGERPASELAGTLRLDSRRDTLGVEADMEVRPLALAGLAGTFPDLPVRPALEGRVRLAGYLDSLTTHVDLRGAGPSEGAGAIRGDGVLTLLSTRMGVSQLALTGSGIDLSRWRAGAPPTRLALTAQVDMAADSGQPAAGSISTALGLSSVAGTLVDTGVAAVRFAAGRVLVDSLRVGHPGAQVTAQGSLGLERSSPGRLEATLDADSLGGLDSLATWLLHRLGAAPDTGGPLQGSARVDAVLLGAVDSLDMEVEVESRGVWWRDGYVGAGRASMTVARHSAARVHTEGAVDTVAWGRHQFGGVEWRLDGPLDSLRWYGRGRIGTRGAALGGGSLVRTAAATTVGVDSLFILIPSEVWYLESPSVVAVGDSVVRTAGVTLKSSVSAGRLILSGTAPRTGPMDVSLEAERVPLPGIAALLQLEAGRVTGEMGATLRVTGTRAAPVMDGGFTLLDAQFGGFKVPFVMGTLQYADRSLSAKGSLLRGETRLLEADALLPLDLALVPVSRRQLPGPIDITITADQAELSVLEALTPTLKEVQGVLTANVGVGGTWDQPALRGVITLAGAAATIPALNARYRDLEGRLTLSGDTIRVDTLFARSGEGSARVRGFVRMERLTRPVLGLQITADRFAALDLRNQLTATASGNVALDGPVYGATLTGRGTVTSGVWYFRDAVTKRVVDLDEPWARALIDTTLLMDEALQEEFQSRFLDSLRIRGMDLTMGSDVWLRSSEANVQLAGTLRVDKEADNYRLRGELQAQRGTYRLEVLRVTREFVVTEGTVRWFGTPDLDAALDIEAEHLVRAVQAPGSQSEGDITVIARLRGTLLMPRLTLEGKERTLPQTELISYLMFGVPSVGNAGVSGEAGNTGAYVASSALSGMVSGELSRALVSDLGVPLDYVDIRPGSASDPFSGSVFTAGWQIGPRTFFIVNAGFCQGRPVTLYNTLGASVQYRMSGEWRTQASFEPLRTCLAGTQATSNVDRQLGLDLFWERRF